MVSNSVLQILNIKHVFQGNFSMTQMVWSHTFRDSTSLSLLSSFETVCVAQAGLNFTT